MAKKKTKLFPSQIRYLEKNPVISFRLKKEEKEKLEEIVKDTNTSVSKWVSDFVRGKVEKEEEKLRLLERNKVLEKANKTLRKKIENKIRFKVPCSVCGNDLVLEPSDEIWKSKIYPTLKEAFDGWCHDDCANES
jgi:DNA-directed RNA polymerase beta' subunit